MSGSCKEIREKLSAYADGELPRAEEERVRAHVAGCAACRDALAAISLTDEAIAAEELPRSDEEWERLASRVDAAVTRAHEQDRHAARTAHGWRRKKPGFFGGLLPAPVAFGSAGTIVAAVLVVLMHGLLDETSREQDLPAEEILAARGLAGSADRDSVPAAPERLRALGSVDGEGGAEAESPAAKKEVLAKSSPREALREERADPEQGSVDKIARTAERSAPAGEPPAASAVPELPAPAPALESKADAPRPVEEELRVSALEADTAAAPAESPAVPETPPARTLTDFAQDYAQRRSASPPPPAPRERASNRTRAQSSRPDAMSRALEERRRETDQALSLALAREVYVFAQERREEGDREGAIRALTLLLDNEQGRIREQAWADLISLEGEKAIEEGEVAEIARVASASDAFLREYPSSRFRLGVIKRRVRLWADAAAEKPDAYCEPARAAEAEWQSAVGGQADPEGAAASERIRGACGR